MEYYKEGQGSLLQCVLTPADPYMPMPNEEIAAKVHQQVRELVSERTSHACQMLACQMHTSHISLSSTCVKVMQQLLDRLLMFHFTALLILQAKVGHVAPPVRWTYQGDVGDVP